MTETPIDISVNSPETLVSFDVLAFIKALLQEVTLHEGSFAFTFVDEPTIIELHKKHLNSEHSTDIITFNLGTDSKPEADIYICIPEARKNAALHNHSFDDEIKLLITHGVLHLIGFTDYDEPSRKEMFDEQDRILKEIQKKS